MVHGNIGKSSADNETGTSINTPSANTTPYNLTVSYSSKETNAINVTARAYDKEDGAAGKNLTYTVQTSTNNSTWTNRGSATGKSGTQVPIQASGLSEYTGYYWRVTVKDTGNLTATSASQALVTTFCSGTGLYCSGRLRLQRLWW